MRMLLKAEGYQSHSQLAEHADRFVTHFTAKKNELLYGKKAANSEFIDRVTEKLVLRDIRLTVRLAILLRDQEWSGYRDGLLRHKERQWKFEPQLYEKTLADKEAELAAAEKQAPRGREAKARIETETLREGFRTVLRSKFINEWRVAKQGQHAEKKTGGKNAEVDEGLADQELITLILESFDEVGPEPTPAQKQQAEQAAAAQEASSEPPTQSPEAKKQEEAKRTAVRKPKSRISHSASTAELNFAAGRGADEAEFLTRIEGAFAKVVEARKLQVSERQLHHCLGVLEHLRRRKAVALVGPVCSGKTQILKIVSQTLQIAYGIIFRSAAINPLTFTTDELYGPANAFDSGEQRDQEEALKKKSIFQIVLDNYQQERLTLKPDERNRFVQSFLIDSERIDPYFMDSLI
jgi:hypothetical protein